MMNHKLKESIKKVHSGKKGDFFVNFYATLSGVFISLICANWISGYNERKEVEQALIYVKQEMVDNEQTAHELYKQIRLEKTSMRFIEKYAERLDSIPKDSLEYYGMNALKSRSFIFKFDALENLKMSGLFSKISNQELAFGISKGYTSTKMLQNLYDSYMERKDILSNDIKKIKEVRRLRGFANPYYWKIYLKYDEGYAYINDLPMLQASKLYRMHIKNLGETVKLMKKHQIGE